MSSLALLFAIGCASTLWMAYGYAETLAITGCGWRETLDLGALAIMALLPGIAAVLLATSP